MSEEKKTSAFAKALAEQPRQYHDFPGSGLRNMGGKELPAIKIRVATKDEEIRARIAAAKELKEYGGDKDDSVTLEDIVNSNILCSCARDHEYPESIPIWPDAMEMRKALSNDQITKILLWTHECIARESPLETKIDSETRQAYMDALAAMGETDIPEAVLSGCTPEWLREMLVHAAMDIAELKRQLAAQERSVQIVEAVTESDDAG